MWDYIRSSKWCFCGVLHQRVISCSAAGRRCWDCTVSAACYVPAVGVERAKPGRMEWISSVILQLPRPHAQRRGRKFNPATPNLLVCWASHNPDPPSVYQTSKAKSNYSEIFKTNIYFRLFSNNKINCVIHSLVLIFYNLLLICFPFEFCHLVSEPLILFVFHIISNLFQHSWDVYIIALLK